MPFTPVNLRPVSTLRLGITCAVLLLLPPPLLHGQTWDGGGLDNNFTTAANWNLNVAPVNNGTANLIFGGIVRLTPVVNASFDVNSVTFNNTAGSFSIGSSGGSILTLRGGGILNNDADTQFFTTPIAFAASSSITAAAGNLDFSGELALGANTVTVSGASTNFVDRVTGTGDLIKNGLGRLNLSAPISQTYGLTINAGTVSIGSATFVGPSGFISVAGGSLSSTFLTLNSGAALDVGSLATYTLGAGGYLRVQSGSTARFGDFYTTSANADYFVTGAGSTLSTTGLEIAEGASIQVLVAGSLTNGGNYFAVGAGGTPGSLRVEGNGSSFTNQPGLAAYIGYLTGSTGAVSFVDGARGSFASTSLRLASYPSSAADLVLASGAQVVAGTYEVAASTAGGVANVLVTGVGSKLTAIFNVADFAIGAPSGGVGTVTLEDGGELVLFGPLTIDETGTLNLNAGILNMVSGQAITKKGALNFNSGKLTLGENLNLGGGPSLLGLNLTLTPGKEIIVPSTRTLTVASPGSLVLDGGRLSAGSLVNNGGTIEFLRGSLFVTGSSGLRIGAVGGSVPLGRIVTLGTGAYLNVGGPTTVNADGVLLLDGGSLEFFMLVNNGSTILQAGNASTGVISNNNGGQILVQSTLSSDTLYNASGATLTLANGTGRLQSSGYLHNNGLLTGSGTLLRPVANTGAGEIRALAGDTLRFTGNFDPNTGELMLQGGTLEFQVPITNAAAGFIAGRGTLYSRGLTNDGQMAFSAGNTDIHGDVTLRAGSRVVTSGGGAVTTFFDDLAHNGTEIFTGAGASTVIFGALSGAGPFTGSGTVYSIGDLRPGTSPANVTFGGNLELGAFAQTVLEIGGTAAGSQYDRLTVAGTLYLSGTLEIQLINGFVPAPGQVFQLFAAGSTAGSFLAVTLPPLPADRFWRTDRLLSNGLLGVAIVPASFAEFASAHGLVQGPYGDEDGDQSSNALEFLFGTDPHDSASAPELRFTHDGLQSDLTFSLPAFPPAGSTYSIEASPDLQNWTILASKTGSGPWIGGATTVAANGVETVNFVATDNDPQRFYRVRATLPE